MLNKKNNLYNQNNEEVTGVDIFESYSENLDIMEA
jgi:hypothetical protein